MVVVGREVSAVAAVTQIDAILLTVLARCLATSLVTKQYADHPALLSSQCKVR